MLTTAAAARRKIAAHVVELQGVWKRFNGVLAVAGVDLRIESGEFLTLLGPSGCGKTTLLRIISGLETPDSGRVLLDGQDVTALPPWRRDVNQVFQSYALFPHLNVWKNIEFGLRMRHIGRRERTSRVEEAIALVSLDGLESRRPAQLSGGQKQRVALARALVCRPKVLLLDEPLAALDAKLRRAMQIELKRLQARVGITFVFVTHDQEEALVLSDRIAVMNQGRIEQLGGASEIYHRPGTPFVADFLGQANLLAAKVESCDGQHAQVLIGSGPSPLRLSIPSAALPADANVGWACIRPERIRLSRSAPSGGNLFCAKVRQRIFRGPICQLLLETDFASILWAISSDDGTAAGETVFAQFDPADVIVLPTD